MNYLNYDCHQHHYQYDFCHKKTIAERVKSKPQERKKIQKQD